MELLNQWRFCGTGILTAALLLAASSGTALVAGARAQEAPAIDVVSPQAGETVTSDDIDVQVAVSNFTVDCAQAGRPNEDGVGHIHLMIDGMSMAQLANFYCGDNFTIPGEGLTPGKHTLIVDLATNDHLDMMDTAKEVEIDYQPANPVPLPAAEDKGTPGVELVSPTDGTTVPAKFTIEVKPVNFEPSAGLEGKQNVPGYGHWHVFVDTPMGDMMMEEEAMAGTPMAEEEMEMGTPMAEGEMDEMHMMAMGGMIPMPGTNSFEVDLTAWGPGEHTIFIEPVQNDHTNFADFGHAEFTVNIEPAA
jgi:hypothetical protein